MQPQDPTTPNTNPATPPNPAPTPNPEQPAQLTPTPSAAPAPAPAPQTTDPGATTPVGPQPAKHGLDKKLIAIILGALLVIAAAVAAYFLFFSGIKLATYNGDKFSLEYPEGYEKKDVDEGVQFNEPGNSETASSVFAFYSEFPEELTQEQVDQYTELFKEQAQSSFGTVANTDIEAKDVKVTEVQYKGQKALQMTGKGVKNGVDAGTLKLIAVLNKKEIYMIGVGAHNSDPGVASATERILNSFTVK